MKMNDSTTVTSNTQNAAHLVAILAWLILFIISTIAASVMVVHFMGQETERSDPVFWSIIAACFCLGFVLLITAHGLKHHHNWARYLGGFLAAISLIAFPVGTVMGLFILSYLHKGWNES
jgi:phosphoglycerol transferase MdoB-like AlkP superfamily enzyme